MRIRQGPFHGPLAQARAEKAALSDRVRGVGKLRVGVEFRREEPIDPAREMFRIGVGHRSGHGHRSPHQTQKQHRRTGHKIDHTPGKQH